MSAETQSLPRYRWDDLRVLLALSRAGTLSGAAGRLGINPSTVGRRLDALEDALGVRLFDRTPDGVRKTAAAEHVLERAEEVERAAHSVVSELGEFETAPEGVVRVTAPPGVVDLFLAEKLSGLLERYPDLRIELDASVGYADLSRREADIAIRTTRPTSGDLVATRLGRTPSVPMASEAILEGRAPLRSLDELPWIAWGADLAHIPDARWVLAHVSPARLVVRTSSLTAQLAAAQSGVGAALFPRIYRSRKPLREIPLARSLKKKLAPFPEGDLWLVGHRALRRVPRIEAVWDYIVESISSMPA